MFHFPKSCLHAKRQCGLFFLCSGFSFLRLVFLQTAQDVVDVIDNVMNMKKEDLQASQRSNKSSSK